MGILKKRTKRSDNVDLICKNCEHVILCTTWGEYKCVKHSRKVFPAQPACDLFRKSKTATPNCECHCQACSERGQEG